LSTHNNTLASPLGPPSAAVQALLERVGTLCVLGQVSEELGIQMLRDAFRKARTNLGADTPDRSNGGIDAFIAGQVLSEWHQNSAFLDAEGNPNALSISAGQFATLCETASVLANPEEVLELLSHSGAVAVNGDRAQATRREFIMDYAHPAAVTRAIRLSAEFTGTLRHNLSRNVREPGLFERSVVSTRLTQRQVPSLLGYLSVHGESFLEDLDAWMSARETSNTGPTIGVGVYLFVSES
jgi:hypothetical protein